MSFVGKTQEEGNEGAAGMIVSSVTEQGPRTVHAWTHALSNAVTVPDQSGWLLCNKVASCFSVAMGCPQVEGHIPCACAYGPSIHPQAEPKCFGRGAGLNSEADTT